MRNISIPKPAVGKNVLLFLAGLCWFCVGTMLVALAYSWLSEAHRVPGWVYLGSGAAAALIIHYFGFQKIAAKNINRILLKSGRQCVFSFFAWKSYVIIAVMVTMGKILRDSSIPKPYLAILYTAIGLALVLSSLKYIRVFIQGLSGKGSESAL